MYNPFERSEPDYFHDKSLELSAKWGRGSITDDATFPETFADPKRWAKEYLVSDYTNSNRYDTLYKQRRKWRMQMQSNVRNIYEGMDENSKSLHQNLESPGGQWSKSLFDLPYQDASKVDVLKNVLYAMKYSGKNVAKTPFEMALSPSIMQHRYREPTKGLKALGDKMAGALLGKKSVEGSMGIAANEAKRDAGKLMGVEAGVETAEVASKQTQAPPPPATCKTTITLMDSPLDHRTTDNLYKQKLRYGRAYAEYNR